MQRMSDFEVPNPNWYIYNASLSLESEKLSKGQWGRKLAKDRVPGNMLPLGMTGKVNPECSTMWLTEQDQQNNNTGWLVNMYRRNTTQFTPYMKTYSGSMAAERGKIRCFQWWVPTSVVYST